MNRRQSFAKIILVWVTAFFASVASAAESWFYWPGRDGGRSGTEALRSHLRQKHGFSASAVKGKSRSQLIVMHDNSHFRRGNKAPMRKTK